jgi:hypothetical protein
MARPNSDTPNNPSTYAAAPSPQDAYRLSTGDLSNPGQFNVNPDIARAKLQAAQDAVNAAGQAIKQARDAIQAYQDAEARWAAGKAPPPPG